MIRILLALLLSQLVVTAQAEIAVIAHVQNPLASLSESEVRKIFLGRLQLLPSSRTEILTLDQSVDSPTLATFYHAEMDMTPSQLSGYRAAYLFSGKGRIPEIENDDLSVLERVKATHNAIGYIDLDAVDNETSLSGIKILYRLP
jgi:ABC-type phosphate transport system substrate-binding protein